MKVGDKVQVFDGTHHKPMGWGKILVIARDVFTDEMIPLIQLEGKSQRKIWGNECNWITEEAFVKGNIRIFNDIKEGGGK